MSERVDALSRAGWGLSESVIMLSAIVAFALVWAIYLMSPPDGLVPLYGFVVSGIGGVLLLYGIFSYLA